MEKSCIWNFNPKDRLPKSWNEFCKMFPIKKEEFYIDDFSVIAERTDVGDKRYREIDKNMLPDRATAEAVLALCQLIQLRNCYNGDWVTDWGDRDVKYVVYIEETILRPGSTITCPELMYFKSKKLRDEFLLNFRPLIEKLKPLYGIKEWGEE